MEELVVKENVKPHSLSYQKGRIAVTGVKEVKSSDDKCIVLALDKQTLTLKGYGLVITDLLLSGGNFGATGTLTSLSYTGRADNTSLLKRLAK